MPLGLLFSEQTPSVYSVYTVIFGLVTLLFTLGLWIGKNWGWLGTVSVFLFVTTADALTLLNLLSILGIPKFAAASEIVYSVVLLLFLVQPHVRAKYQASKLATEAKAIV